MPYVTPPTFADGNLLSASQLNTLSDDVEFLYGVVNAVNVPFGGITTTSTLSDANNIWIIRHQHRYLHYKITLNSGDMTGLVIEYNDNDIVIDNSASATQTYTGYYDLNALGLTVGTRYPIWVECGKDSNDFELTVWYIVESDSTTI